METDYCVWRHGRNGSWSWNGGSKGNIIIIESKILSEPVYFLLIFYRELSFIVRQLVTGSHGVFHVGRDRILRIVVNQSTINLMFYIFSRS